MSDLQTVGPPSMADAASETHPDPSQFDAIVQAAFGDTARSSGSLESTTSSSSSPSADGSSSTSQSVPSLVAPSTTASAASSKTPSPCPSILRSNSAPPNAFPTLSMSTSSSGTCSPNVTFAPLPQTEPRKRNSSHPLGVAARSRLLRHRRMLRERGLNPDDYPYHHQQYEQQYQYQYGYGSGVESHPYGDEGAAVDFPEMQGEEGHEEHVRVRRARTASDAGYQGEEEDPFVALGKLVKGAGKTLWKSLSMRDMRGKERDAAKAKNRDKEKEKGADGEPRASEGSEGARGGGEVRGKTSEEVPRRSIVGTGHLFDDDEAAPRRASSEGGVWEEEVTEDSWKKLLSKPEPVPDRTSEETNEDGQATPTPASTEAAGGPTVLTTVVVAQPSTKTQ